LKKLLCSALLSLVLLCSCTTEVAPSPAPTPAPTPHPLQEELDAFHAGFSPSESYDSYQQSIALLEAVIFSPEFSLDDIALLERTDFHPVGHTLHGERGDIYILSANLDVYSFQKAWTFQDSKLLSCWLPSTTHLASVNGWVADFHLFDSSHDYERSDDIDDITVIDQQISALVYDGEALTTESVPLPYLGMPRDIPMTVTAKENAAVLHIGAYPPVELFIEGRTISARFCEDMVSFAADGGIGEYGLLLGLTDRQSCMRTLFLYPEDGVLYCHIINDEILFQRDEAPYSLAQYQVEQEFPDEYTSDIHYWHTYKKLFALPYGVNGHNLTKTFELEDFFGYWNVAEWPLYVGENVLQLQHNNYYSGGGTFASYIERVYTLPYEKLFSPSSDDILGKGGDGFAYYENPIDLSLTGGIEAGYIGFPEVVLDLDEPVLRRSRGQWRMSLPLKTTYYHPGNGRHGVRITNFYDTDATPPIDIFGDIYDRKSIGLGMSFEYAAYFGDEWPQDLLVSPDSKLAIYRWLGGCLDFYSSNESRGWWNKENGEQFASYQLLPQEDIVSLHWLDSDATAQWKKLLVDNDEDENNTIQYALPAQDNVPLLFVTISEATEQGNNEISIEGDGIRQTITTQDCSIRSLGVEDYNFDGYWDIMIPVSWGYGPNVTCDIYIWSPQHRQFRFWVSMMNPDIIDDGMLTSFGRNGYSTSITTEYIISKNMPLLYAHHISQILDEENNQNIYLYAPESLHTPAQKEPPMAYYLYITPSTCTAEVYDCKSDALMQTLTLPPGAVTDDRYYNSIAQRDCDGDGCFDLVFYLDTQTNTSERDEYIFYWNSEMGKYLQP